MTSGDMVCLCFVGLGSLILYLFGCLFMFSFADENLPDSRLLRALSLILVLLSWIGIIIFWVIYIFNHFIKFLYNWIKDGLI